MNVFKPAFVPANVGPASMPVGRKIQPKYPSLEADQSQASRDANVNKSSINFHRNVQR
jgi:hypothetical protein